MTDGEIHSMNAYREGCLPCGCSRYYINTMGCDHFCDYATGEAELPINPASLWERTSLGWIRVFESTEEAIELGYLNKPTPSPPSTF